MTSQNGDVSLPFIATRSTGALALEPIENAHGATTSYLRKTRAAIGKIRTGIAGGTAYRGTIVFIGDSKTMGAGADGSAGNTAGAEPLSKPSNLSTILTANGLTSLRNSCFGYRGTVSPAALTAYDPRIVFDPALALSGVAGTLGGFYFRMSGLVTQSFAPTGNVDTVDIYTRQSPGDGTMTVKANSGSTLATIVCDGANAIVKTTITLGASASYTIQFQRSAGNFCFVLGLRAYLSTSSGFDVINAGAYGTESGFHSDTSTPWTAINMLAQLPNPALCCIQLGTNDMGNGATPMSTTLLNIQALANAAHAAGFDVILENPTFGPNGAGGTNTQRAALQQGLLAIALAQNCMMVDNAARFISYADAFSLGMMGSSLHETGSGYADEAQFLARVLLN